MTQTTITTYDKYMYFTWRGISSSRYNCFIVNDKHSLQFVNAPSFSNNYADAMYQNKSYFLGTSVQRKTLTFKVACDRITLAEYREFLSWLNIYSIGFLQLDYEDWYGYNVKLSAITESEKYPIYESGCEMIYMVVLTLTFETTDDFYAVHKYQTTGFIERYPLNHLASENLVANSGFTSTSNWTASGGTGSVANGVYTLVGNEAVNLASILQDATAVVGNLYYISSEFMTPDSDISEMILRFNGHTAYSQTSPIANTWYKKSHLRTAISTSGKMEFLLYHTTSINGKTLNCRNPFICNITDLVSRGILPSHLPNTQYKEILDNIFSPQGYRITNSIFNSEEKEEIHLSSNTEGDQEVLYIGLDNYGTLDTSFKLGISQMNGQFTFNYIIVDSTEWVSNPDSLASHAYEYLGYIETKNLDPIYTTSLEYDSNSGQCTSSGILAARAQAQGQLVFETIDMPGNIVIPPQKRLILQIILTKISDFYPSFMVQFQKRTQVI